MEACPMRLLSHQQIPLGKNLVMEIRERLILPWGSPTLGAIWVHVDEEITRVNLERYHTAFGGNINDI